MNVPGHFTGGKGQIWLCCTHSFPQGSSVCISDLNQLMKFHTITPANALWRSSLQQQCDMESKLCRYVGCGTGKLLNLQMGRVSSCISSYTDEVLFWSVCCTLLVLHRAPTPFLGTYHWLMITALIFVLHNFRWGLFPAGLILDYCLH